MRWIVENRLESAALSGEAWASAARARLAAAPVVTCAEVDPGEYEVDGVQIGWLTVNVTLESADSASAAAFVERQITLALGDVVGDRDVGWMVGPWTAAPAALD